MKKDKKIFTSYREQLIDLAKLYGIVEIKSYYKSNKRLTVSQLELILIKNKIKLPINRSNARVIEKQEIREKSITNIYLSISFIIFLGCLIVSRPFIKNIVNEVKFTYVASEYKSSEAINLKTKKTKKTKSLDKNLFSKKSDNTISLNAATTMNLFEDLDYNLKDVRNGQKVKPIYFTKLPKDLNTLGDTKKKKEIFIKIILPLILDENQKILEDRKRLFKIVSKNFNTVGERVWIKRRFKEYKVEDKDLAELKTRMDTIPVSIALAQAAKESGWGTSRFALEGNALFGQWTWGEKGIVPLNQSPDEDNKVLQFQILKASVRAYKNNLNTHNGYKEFREARAKFRQNEKEITGLNLTKYLKNYAATGEEYTKILEKIITQNSLTDFDTANLLPTKLKSGIAL